MGASECMFCSIVIVSEPPQPRPFKTAAGSMQYLAKSLWEPWICYSPL
jgi:hypothetical protein